MSEIKDNKSSLKLGDVNVTFPLIAAERMYEEIKKVVGDGSIRPTNIIEIMIQLMQIVDAYGDLNGSQKKAVVLEAILRLIDAQVEDEVHKKQFKELVLLTLPSVVDSFIKIDSKKLKIKHKKRFFDILRQCISKKKPKESNFYIV